MLTREQIQEHLSLTKRAVRSTAIELIAKSHIAALDEIDRLTAELAAAKETIENGNGYAMGFLAGQQITTEYFKEQYAAEIKKALTGEPIQNYDTVTHTKPQGNTTGNLLIPKNEEGSVKA
jgi:hypothetical protein